MIVMPILSSYCQTRRHVMCIRNNIFGYFIVELKYGEFESLSYWHFIIFIGYTLYQQRYKFFCL